MSSGEFEKVVISAPMSFAGSWQRSKQWLWDGKPDAWKWSGGWLAIAALLSVWWPVNCAWYLVFGLLLVPYRLLRRGGRKRKREALMHKEMLEAINESRKSG